MRLRLQTTLAVALAVIALPLSTAATATLFFIPEANPFRAGAGMMFGTALLGLSYMLTDL